MVVCWLTGEEPTGRSLYVGFSLIRCSVFSTFFTLFCLLCVTWSFVAGATVEMFLPEAAACAPRLLDVFVTEFPETPIALAAANGSSSADAAFSIADMSFRMLDWADGCGVSDIAASHIIYIGISKYLYIYLYLTLHLLTLYGYLP